MDRPADPHIAAFARPLTPIDGLTSFWSDLGAASNVALLLDYDGTLAPFAVDRMAAWPLAGVVPAIHEIIEHTDTLVMLISGRPTAEIRHLVGDINVTVIGSHGWELATPGNLPVTRALQPARLALLEAAELIAREVAGSERTERKHASVAVHLRGVDPLIASVLEQDVRKAWQSIVAQDGMTIRPFNGGVELRAGGWDKGVAVAEVLEAAEPAFAAYLGDDDTDEDAFRVIGRWGVGIRVGDPRETLATGRLDMERVPAFLDDWGRVRQG